MPREAVPPAHGRRPSRENLTPTSLLSESLGEYGEGPQHALVGGPGLLCINEPFSAQDVLTAELLRAEVYRLWSDRTSSLSSILIITHLIDEAVYLGDRIVILGANPGTVKQEIVNTLPHPREYRHPEFLRMV